MKIDNVITNRQEMKHEFMKQDPLEECMIKILVQRRPGWGKAECKC